MSFARLLIDEYGADVDERYERDTPIHRRWTLEAISIPLYEAVRNNFPSMVELLLEKGADATVRGHRGMPLVECAWDNKHSGMVQLLREKGVPEGPETKGKDASTLDAATPARTPTPTPVRAVRTAADSSDDEMDPDERRMVMYQAIQP